MDIEYHGGTADSFFPYICNRWGLEMEILHSSYDAFERCKNGYFVVLLAGEGLWTSAGHFILAVGTRGDEIQIFDPYLYAGKFDTAGRRGAGVSVEGTSCFVQIDKFKEYSNIQDLWAIKVGDAQPDDYVPPVGGDTKFVSANSGLNVRTGRGTDYSIVTTLPKGTSVTVYDDVDGWSRIGNDMYVCSEYLSSSPQSGSQSSARTGVVNANSGLNVRSGPSTGYGRVGGLPNGTTVTIYGEQNGWYKIGNGQWVCGDYIAITGSSSSGTRTARVTANSGLNVRSGPSTGYSIVGGLSKGTTVTVYEESDGWAKIGNGQWVCEDYLNFV